MFRSLFSFFQDEQKAIETHHQAPSADDASRAITEALREMEHVIERLSAAKSRAQAERDEAAAQLQNYQAAYTDTMNRAKTLVLEGRNDEARALLGEQQSLETVIASFERIVGNMTAAVQKLVVQIDSMRLQREELKARRTVLTAQLASAASHEEFVEKLRISGVSHELLERETIHAELRLQMENPDHAQTQEFTTISAETAFKELEQRIVNEIAQERAEKEHLRNEASLRRFHLAFTTMEKEVKKEQAENTRHFPDPQATQPPSSIPDTMNQEHQRRTMEDFFAEQANKPLPKPAPQPPSETTEDKINNFFLRNP